MTEELIQEAPTQEQPQQAAPPPQEPPAKRKLYDNLNGAGFYTKSYEDFDKQFSTPEKREKLYNSLSGAKYYTKSKDEFEKQFFNDPIPQEPPAPEEIPTVDTIRQLQQQADTLPKDTNVTTNMAGNQLTIVADTTGAEKQKEAQTQLTDKLADTAKEWGVDKTDLKDAVKNFPHYSDEGVKKMAQLAKENPTQYTRFVAGSLLQNTLAKAGAEVPHEVKMYDEQGHKLSSIGAANKVNQLMDVHDVAQLAQNVPLQQQLINTYTVGNAIARKDANEALRYSQAPLINTLDNTVMEEYQKSGMQGLLNKYQFAGLLTEKLFDPQQYEEDTKMLNYLGSTDGQKDSKEGVYDFKRGAEQLKWKLEASGRENDQRYLAENKIELNKNIEHLAGEVKKQIESAQTDEEKQSLVDAFNQHPMVGEMARLEGAEEDLRNAVGTDEQRFPMRATEAADRIVQEASDDDGFFGSAWKMIKRFPASAGKIADETAGWIQNAFINMLATREVQAELKIHNIGHSKSYDNLFFQPQSYSGVQRPFDIPKSVVKGVQDILNGDLPDIQKKAAAMKYVRDNQDKITVNPNAGQHNWTFKSGLNAGLDMVGAIVGIGMQSMAMGNVAGGASKIKNMITAFTPMFMSMQQDLYGKAVANGENDPYLKTTAESAIVSMAGLIGGNTPAKVLRGMLGKQKVVGRIIAGMDDQTIQSILSKNKKWVSQIGEFAKGSAKQLGLASTQYGLIAPVAETAFQRNYLGEDVDLKGKIKDGMINTWVTMAIPALFHGVQSVRATNVSPMQRLSIYEAALNSKNRLEIIALQEKAGQLSEVQAHQMRTIVERAAKALKELPGDKKMTEQKRADIVYNMVRKEALKGRLKDAKTDLHKSNIEAKIDEIDAEISDIKKAKVEEPKPEEAVEQPTANDLSPEEQKVIQAIQETMKDRTDMGGKVIYEASLDPAKQKEIIQNLLDQSVDAESFMDMANVDVLDAVYMLQEKTGQESAYKTHEELGVDTGDIGMVAPPEKKSGVSVIMPGEQRNIPTTTIEPKTVHTSSVAKVREKVSPLSEEPVSQFEGKPIAQEKVGFNKDTKGNKPFVTKSGKQKVIFRKGKMVVKNINGLPVSRATARKAVDEYFEAFEFNHGEKAKVDDNWNMFDPDIQGYVAQSSENPYEIASIYGMQQPVSMLNTKEMMIAEYGMGKFKPESFYQHGDRNLITADLAKNYFPKKNNLAEQRRAADIDATAKEMSDHYGVEITPQDIIDFMVKHEKGVEAALQMVDSDAKFLAEKSFKELTGIELTPEVAKKVIDKEYNKLSKVEQELAQQEYETAEQLQNEYWEAYEATDGFTKESSPYSVEQTGKTKEGDPAEFIGITHEQMNEVARELGLPEYEKSPEKEADWIAEAKQRVTDGEMPALLDKMRNGEMITAVEQKMIGVYAADLKAKLNKDPKNDSLLAEWKRMRNLSDIVGGRFAGQSLRARQGIMPVEETVVDFMTRNMEETNVDRLTDKQKEDNIRENEEITSAKEQYEAKIAKLEAEVAKATAERKIKEQAKKAKKNKTHEDYVADRKTLKEKLREAKLSHEQKMKDMGIHKQGIAPTLTGDMIKIIAKIIESHVDEGVNNLAHLIKKAKLEIQEELPDITDEDIRDIFTGEFNEKKSKNQLLSKRYELMMEAKLQKKLEALMATGKKAKTEKQKRIYNKEVTELKDKVKELEKQIAKEERESKEPKTVEEKEASALKAIKTRTQKQLDHIQEQLNTGNFTEDVKKNIPLDKEARELKDKLMDLKIQRETRILREKYQNQSGLEKTGQFGLELANLTRTIMSSTDLSAPFRQGLVAFVAHPIVGIKSFGKMLGAAVSQKQVDRFFYDLHNSADYHLMEQTGLGITDPLNPKLTAKEEAFMNNIAQKIPIAGTVIKGSERAYVMFLNNMRVEVFRQGKTAFEANGKTMENNPQLYKSLADHINNITGRGKLHPKLEGSAPVLNAFFFSPRLMASRLNLLTNFMNPRWYKRTPIEVRKMYFKDMAAFTVAGVALMGLSKLALGDDLETDPRSTDFLKYKSGNERIDVLGGFQQYLRVIAQVLSGEKVRNGKVTKLDGKGAFGEDKVDVAMRFMRGKLAPNVALATDIIAGRDMMGNEIKLTEWNPDGKKEKGIGDLAGTYLLPMTATDIKRVFDDKDMRAVGLLALAVFGASVQSFDRPAPKSTGSSKPTKVKHHRPKKYS
jgi:hypothetical protein